MMEKWIRQSDAEAMSTRFAAIRVQNCPKCNAQVIKCGCLNVGKKVVCDEMEYCPNQACDHIHCTRCNYDFCWRCLGKYPHDMSSCAKSQKLEQGLKQAVHFQQTYKNVTSHVPESAEKVGNDPEAGKLLLSALDALVETE
eukprot:CAMPEP_0114543054 /NCGR_PEP_ID=MMETSP0114-20121206/2155_1 /TAXON_ID=31324 /ORGANISM="Goniomonas sp, Strain m" /LENGTH=140 /DNA_ID=CAMNT_0001727375 /DNA_START=206 /DNA_END=626 /DNA_ORIENTATION=+